MAVTTTSATTSTNATLAGFTPATGIQVIFWAAPNPPQGVFWKDMATAYMKAYPGTSVNVSAMPESPTSEAAIQTALAGHAGPAGSENIFIGFGHQLVSSQAVVPLDTMPGWNELISARHMEKTIQGWKFPDGHYYVLPIYTNAILLGWRIDILKQAGVDTPPRTYTELLDLGAKLKQKFPDKFVWARAELTQDTWYQRWFDFDIFYDAASNGQALTTGNQFSADDTAAVATLGLFSDLASKQYLLTQTTTNPFENGQSVMDVLGPWTFPTWAQQFPDLKLNETYTLTTPIVPDNYPAGQPVKTFADAKGLVIYAQASPDAQKATWDFYRWVFSDPQHDLDWFQTTNLPPARDDLAANSIFNDFFSNHPELVLYAQEIPNAVPPAAGANYQQVDVLLGQQAVIPVVNGQKQPQQAWTDFKNAAQTLLK